MSRTDSASVARRSHHAAQNGAKHNGSHEISEIGRIAREIRRAHDGHLDVDRHEKSLPVREGHHRQKYILDKASTFLFEKAEALKQTLPFAGPPQNVEDISTLFVLLDEAIDRLDTRYGPSSLDVSDGERDDMRPGLTSDDIRCYGEEVFQIRVLRRTLYLALHALSPSPLVSDGDVAMRREEAAIEDIAAAAREHAQTVAND